MWLAGIKDRSADTMAFRHTIVRLMSLCHGTALKEIGGVDADECETIDPQGLDNATLEHLQACGDHGFNRVEVLLHLIQSLITCLSSFIGLSEVFESLSKSVGCRRLLN